MLHTKCPTLTFHPVDNLLRRPLRYRLHGFFNTILETKICQNLATWFLDLDLKKKNVVTFFKTARCCSSVCAHSLNNSAHAWLKAGLKSSTPPHCPVWDQCYLNVLPGRLGKITIGCEVTTQQTPEKLAFLRTQINWCNLIVYVVLIS